MDLTAQIEAEFQTFVTSLANKLIAKVFPNVSPANQAHIAAIIPHVEAIVASTLGVLLIKKIGTAVPAVSAEVNAVLAAVGVPAIVPAK